MRFHKYWSEKELEVFLDHKMYYEQNMIGVFMKSILQFSFLLFCCTALVNFSCEDIDLEGEEAGVVQGFWELNRTTGSNTFLLISDTEVNFYYYDASEGCITIDAYQVVRIDGTGFYILTQEGLEENRVLAISRSGTRIHVRDINDTQSDIVKYSESEVDINTLAPECIDPTDVLGKWELIKENEPTVYLSITLDSIKVIDTISDQECFFISQVEILEISGNIFTLSDNDPNANSSTQKVTIIRTADGIEVERVEDEEVIKEIYVESEADFSSFEPVCNFGPLPFFEGNWQFEDFGSEDSPEFYLTFGLDFISFHFLIGDPINDPETVCFEIEHFDIIEIEEQSISVKGSREPFEEVTYTLDYREEEGLLYLDDTQDILRFFRTTIDDNYINNQCSVTSGI
ncbi:MAG: hypothetical protein BalsKO_24130 [Balneolaceae bacterium]